jgi:hypothetical protein
MRTDVIVFVTTFLDASRFSPERLVETLLAAGGVQAALVAT